MAGKCNVEQLLLELSLTREIPTLLTPMHFLMQNFSEGFVSPEFSLLEALVSPELKFSEAILILVLKG